MTMTMTYPWCLLEGEVDMRVWLEAGDEETVEGDGGGQGEADAQAAAEGDVPLRHPAALLQFGEHYSDL